MATQGGPAKAVSVQSGGRQAGGPALPVVVLPAGSRVEGGPATAVYVVTSGQVKGGPAVPVVAAAAGARAEGGVAIPIYVVSGAFTDPMAYTNLVKATSTANLIAYWPLAETSGSVATDESGNGRNGAYTAVTLGQTGIGDGRTAASFNGTTSFCNIYSASLNGAFTGGEHTIAFWAKGTTDGVWLDNANRQLFRLFVDGNNFTRLIKQNNNDLNASYVAGGLSNGVGITAAARSGWVHFAFTTSKSNNRRIFYINGVQNGPTVTVDGTWAGSLSATECAVGAANTTPVEVWNGSMAHVAVWKTELTPSQVSGIARSPPAGNYGVLQPQASRAATTIAAGIPLRTLELGWDQYEPAQNNFSGAYTATQQANLAAMVAAGARVVLDLGLQYPPGWATAIRPFVDQASNTSTSGANSIWSATVRSAIATYIARVFADLGTNFAAVRLGSGAASETLYPPNSGATKSYWAFDADAQAACPVPGWKPGDASPSGQATTFWNWYVAQLVNTMNWVQSQVRLAYSGPIHQLMPGQGIRPEQVAQLISTNLTDATAFASERGAAWDTVVSGITNRTNVVVYCSSLADGSGVNEASGDHRDWSAAHWIASNADIYAMAKAGENPGHNDYATMQTTFSQAGTYGYSPLMWAFESELYDGTHATLAQYAALIRG